MPRRINPRTIAAPASQFSHGVIHSGRGRRLVMSGQVGIALDGSVPAGLAEQMEQAWDNVFAILAEAGMGPADLIKITVYITVPGSVGLYRSIRDRRLGKSRPAATYLEVAGLADPRFLVEIEGEAVSEEPDLQFLERPGRDVEHDTPPRRGID